MARGTKVGVKGNSRRRIRQREQDSDESDEEYRVGEDEECDDSDEYCSLDGDESEEILADFLEVDFKTERVVRSTNTRRISSSRRGNKTKKLRKKRRVSYTEDDDEDDGGDAEFLSSDKKAYLIKKPQEKKRVFYAEVDDDDEEDYTESTSSGRKGNHIKKPRERRRVSYAEEEDEDYAEFMSSGRKGNQIKTLRAKRRVSYTEEDDEDDSEFLSSNRDETQIKKPGEKRRVSYKEDDEEEETNAEFMLTESDSSTRDGNQIKKSQEKRRVSYKEEEDDENDAEFMLSESDFVDDEDERPKMKKNEKVRRYHLQKKSVRRGRKKSRKSKILKKSTRSKPRNHRFNRKLDSSKERSVTNKNQEVEKQSKKISRRRKRRVIAGSDSDFVSSASSDHQYTISEEEREQMKEARVYCANLRAKLRSSSSGQEEETMCEQKKYPIRKGKEKVEDTKDEVGKQVCGICLSEEGKRTVRGVLNCCRHYFCFSCIMEWSKVESRCPLCKQRFATITKSTKSDSGFDLRTVVIPVPECDQVYQPSEEELRGYLDPYENVICTECHHGGEDALMLLCDICDSPAHTFCVGLGREVPEGNWYCEGCRPTVFGSQNSQRPTPTSDRRLSNNASDFSSPMAGGFDLNELYVPDTPLTQETHVLPEPRLPGGDFVPAPAGTVATTLRERRRIHRMHHRFLNNNRMIDSIARSSGTSASSSGIRLFGSQLNQARDSTPQQTIAREMSAHHHALYEGREDDVMPSMRDTNLFSPRARDSTPQQTTTLERSAHHTFFEGKEDNVMASTRDTNLFSPRGNQFGVQVQNSALMSVNVSLQAEVGRSGTTLDSRLGYAQLHPCTSKPSIGSDASPSPYACREAIGSSRTSQGGLHTPS